MLGSCDLVALVGTADPDRARRFYDETLGLRLVSESSFACVFDAHGTTLRVTVVERVIPAPYTVLGWSVPDIAATVRGLGARGVVFERYQGVEQDDQGIWRAPGGAQVAWFRDPDSNTLSVTEVSS